MIRTFAFIILISPVVIFGFFQSYKETYRLKDLHELLKALNIFKNEINYSNKIITDTFLSISNKVSEPISTIFYELGNNIDNYDDSFEESFSNIITKCSKKTFLSTQDINEFISLSSTINHLDISSIISSVNIFSQYIKIEISQLEKTSKLAKKTSQSLTILSALLLLIILL